jgi:diguanylate cyclase (GGDEF)-like protein
MPSIDKLTGLVSGVELISEISDLVKAGKPFSLVMFDIDNLFTINDKFGHEAGDAVFRAIAKHLSETFPAPCQAFRDTRDEFDVLLPGVSKETAFLLAEQARIKIAAETLDFQAADGTPLTQSISGGVASHPEDGARGDELMRQADAALLRAKKAGRNQVCLVREEKMMPKTSHYTPTQLEKLSEVAGEQGVGEAVLLRAALDDLLRKYDK